MNCSYCGAVTVFLPYCNAVCSKKHEFEERVHLIVRLAKKLDARQKFTIFGCEASLLGFEYIEAICTRFNYKVDVHKTTLVYLFTPTDI